jgi:hypothetical protein
MGTSVKKLQVPGKQQLELDLTRRTEGDLKAAKLTAES